jgi:hypothetical protein
MKIPTATVIAGALSVLSLPALAVADKPASNPHKPTSNHESVSSSPNSANSSSAQCRAERSALGEANFKNTYGTNANKSNAFGKCVSRQAALRATNEENASKRCRAEQTDPSFSATHSGKTFEQYYGTNRNGHNAFGKCVSRQAQERTADQQQARLNAAAKCRAEQRSDPTAFKVKYGTNRNKSNAFGKCVSKTAHTNT